MSACPRAAGSTLIERKQDMTIFERRTDAPKSDSANCNPQGSGLQRACARERWDWQTFSGDPADIWDHSASCDICGHMFSAALRR
jgi:hypothetical protein